MENVNAAPSENILTTTKKINMYKKLRNLQLKLSRCKNRRRKHLITLKITENIMKHKKFLELVENTTSAETILNLLKYRKRRRRKRRNRFTFNEQITVLPIYTHSPKAYQFLCKIFLLPEPNTLKKFIQKVVNTPSINKEVLKKMKKKAKTMFAKTRLCVLLFEEVTLHSNISYSMLGDKINNCKVEGNPPKFASHAVVFMLKGLFKKYMQPIVYTLSSEPTKPAELQNYIQNIIKKVKQAGFVVVATVCKQGGSNQEAIEGLIEDTRREKLKSGEEHKLNTFYVGNLEIIPLYDPPSLLKDIRNNLLDMPLAHENKEGNVCTAKWEHIQMLYAKNLTYQGTFRMLHKLTDQHIVPGKVNKEKVKFASQVFSHRVAAFMYADSNPHPSHGIPFPEGSNTAHLILLIDELFDTMNGSPGRSELDYKPFLRALEASPRCPHRKKWTEAKKAFKSMELLNGNTIHAPTIKAYLWNIEGFECVSRKLAIKYGISSVWTKRLNQDTLEKFLGSTSITIGSGINSGTQPESN